MRMCPGRNYKEGMWSSKYQLLCQGSVLQSGTNRADWHGKWCPEAFGLFFKDDRNNNAQNAGGNTLMWSPKLINVGEKREGPCQY